MIQWMHALSKSWMATLLMGVLALSFVVWGVGDIFTGNASNSVATVGKTGIDQNDFRRAYRNFLRNQGAQMGADITPEMAQSMGLGTVALQQMISRTALNNEAARLGLVTPDAAVAENVRGMDVFKDASGQFNRMSFAQAIGGAGYTEEQFLEEVRSDMTREQLTGAVEGSFVLPPGYAQALFLYINEKRAADFVILTPEAAGTVAPPSEAALAAYVKANAARFSTPEYRDAEYAAITPADVAGGVTVTDAMIKQDYEAKKATYIVPERRDVQQIEFKTQKEAADARARIAAGTGFDALATSRGMTPAQLSLGTLTQSDLPDEARAKALFSLPLNEVSQPIPTGFGGFVLARVTKIQPGSSRSLDEVKDELRKGLETQLAANKLVDAANAFADARGEGDDLAEAAKKAGMKVSRVQTDRNGLMPDGNRAAMPADPELVDAIFRAEVGEDGDPFPTKAGNYIVVKVNGVTPPKLKTMDQVRAQALEAWTAEQRGRLLADKAKQLAAQAAKDKSLDGIARTLKVAVQKSPALSRNTNDTMFSAAFTQKLFAAAPGGVEFGPQGASGNFIIARVTGISHPPANNPADPQYAAGARQLADSVAGDFAISLANAARAQQGVTVNMQLVNSVTGAGGS